jgi:hypothetical protein
MSLSSGIRDFDFSIGRRRQLFADCADRLKFGRKLNGRLRRFLAVDAPLRRRAGVAPIEPLSNGGSTIDTRPSP